ncbi:MAG TPA: hypothetical protein VF816_08165 [Rhodocyclaceae bacterium]
MQLSRFLIFLVLVGVLGYAWEHRRASSAAEAAASESPNGFVLALHPAGAPPEAVAILAPENCPSERAQRASSLADDLERRGIPVFRSAHGAIVADNPTPQMMERGQRAADVINGAVPAVFIRGWAKSNPTTEEVVAEYERTR